MLLKEKFHAEEKKDCSPKTKTTDIARWTENKITAETNPHFIIFVFFEIKNRFFQMGACYFLALSLCFLLIFPDPSGSVKVPGWLSDKEKYASLLHTYKYMFIFHVFVNLRCNLHLISLRYLWDFSERHRCWGWRRVLRLILHV